jgi:hypothetical protein
VVIHIRRTKNMKIEITIGKPALEEHRGPRSQFAATVKVEGKSWDHGITVKEKDKFKLKTMPVEFVGETEIAAVESLCSELLIGDTIADMIAFSKKPK